MKQKETLWTIDFQKLIGARLFLAIPFYFMIAIMPLYIMDTWQDAEKVGFAMGGFTIAAVLMRPLTGIFLDSFNRKSVYIFFLLFFAGSFFLYPITGGFLLYVLIRILHGASWGGSGTAGHTLIVDLAPNHRRGEAISIYGVMMTLAMAFGPALAKGIKDIGDYDGLFVVGGLFSLVALLLAIFAKTPQHERVDKSSSIFKWSSILSIEAMPAALFILFTQIPYGVLMTFSSIYIKEIEGANIGVFFLTLALGMFIARSTMGKVFDKRGPLFPILSGVIIMIIGYTLLSVTKEAVYIYIAAILVGLGAGAATSVGQAIANAHVAPEKRGAANSTYLTFHDAGIGVGAIIFGKIINLYGYHDTFAILAGVVLTALLLFIGFTYPCYKKHLK